MLVCVVVCLSVCVCVCVVVVVCLSTVCHRCIPTETSVQTLREGRNIVIIELNVSVCGSVSVCLCVCVCSSVSVHSLSSLYTDSDVCSNTPRR